jgi:hypothetical protein
LGRIVMGLAGDSGHFAEGIAAGELGVVVVVVTQ